MIIIMIIMPLWTSVELSSFSRDLCLHRKLRLQLPESEVTTPRLLEQIETWRHALCVFQDPIDLCHDLWVITETVVWNWVYNHKSRKFLLTISGTDTQSWFHRMMSGSSLHEWSYINIRLSRMNFRNILSGCWQSVLAVFSRRILPLVMGNVVMLFYISRDPTHLVFDLFLFISLTDVHTTK